MFRKLAAILLIALALATLAVYARAVMSPLTLSIGSGAVALVQAGPTLSNNGNSFGPAATTGPFYMTLTAPSTAGTALVGIISSSTVAGSLTVAALPAGWVKLGSQVETTNSDIEVWAYPNNPGGISVVTVTFSAATTGDRFLQMTEWSNAAFSSMLDTSGGTSAAAGSTLTPTTSRGSLVAGEIAIAAWIQGYAIAQTATFTTPSGWTRLGDNGTLAGLTDHYDAEYLIGPTAGSPVTTTLTSNRVQTTAAGIIVVLKVAAPVTDQTAYLAY